MLVGLVTNTLPQAYSHESLNPTWGAQDPTPQLRAALREALHPNWLALGPTSQFVQVTVKTPPSAMAPRVSTFWLRSQHGGTAPTH